MRKLGCQPAARRMSASIDDVVVLPWLPATAIVRRVATIARSASARRSTGHPALVARRRPRGCSPGWRSRRPPRRASSGRLPASCPTCVVDAEQVAAVRSARDSRRSEPLTRWPMRASTVAIALIAGAADADDVHGARRAESRSRSAARADLLDEIGEAGGGVGPAERAGGRAHRRAPRRGRRAAPRARGRGGRRRARRRGPPPRPRPRRAPRRCAVWWSPGAPGSGTRTAASRPRRARRSCRRTATPSTVASV